MVKSKYSYAVPSVVKLDSCINLISGTYIVVIHANKIPPHLGVLTEGKFYSLKANGKDFGVHITILGAILDRKQIATLFFKVSNDKLIIKEVIRVFEAAGNEISENQTCLTPLQQIFSSDYPCSTIAALLRRLEELNKIEQVFGLHLPDEFGGIPYYDVTRIQDRIKFLKDGK